MSVQNFPLFWKQFASTNSMELELVCSPNWMHLRRMFSPTFLPSFLPFFLSNSVGYTWPDVLKQCSKNVPQINIFAYFSWKGEKGERKPTSRAKTNVKSKSKQHNSNIFARVPLRHSYPHYNSLVCFLSSPIPRDLFEASWERAERGKWELRLGRLVSKLLFLEIFFNFSSCCAYYRDSCFVFIGWWKKSTTNPRGIFFFPFSFFLCFWDSLHSELLNSHIFLSVWEVGEKRNVRTFSLPVYYVRV